jgi:hypothetical protein
MPNDATKLAAAILAHAATAHEKPSPDDALKQVIRNYRQCLKVVTRLEGAEVATADGGKTSKGAVKPTAQPDQKQGWFGRS